ncbi:zinc-binding dehydrogenase [Halorhodospira halochloris]|uniref:zinc-binding dehydrogenase n=1 Tax=Halorhodospira halochloris TaxID=1052 RepID=UPI001EE8106B|nr:zinc-binding dehydrogenase [Halorhodospira halochloris]MCG5530174.1 zinc-binding dehydrogenase [Halorhodospira halochloris]MCG5548032.1 zinc-binding dehydrogenase [Halorhodospira halochloris]
MRCVQMTAIGGPEVLRVEDSTAAEPGPRQAKVKISAAGINPIDTKIRSRGLFSSDASLPAVLGCDGAGVVEAIGEGVERVSPGDRVFYFNGGIGFDPGNYAEYAVVDERCLAIIPQNIDHVTAAATPLAALTAWEGLFDRGRLGGEETVLIHAGAGGVGHLAIQLASETGARVLTTVSDDKKECFVGELGADEVIRYRERDFVDVALELTDGEGVDLVLDCVGGETCARSLHALATYGRLVTILALPEGLDWQHARMHNLSVAQELMLTPMVLGRMDLREHQTSILEAMATRLAAGRVKVHVEKTWPLERAEEAHRYLEAGGVMGKLALTID